jgi:hypothetical protein
MCHRSVDPIRLHVPGKELLSRTHHRPCKGRSLYPTRLCTRGQSFVAQLQLGMQQLEGDQGLHVCC